VYPYFKQMCVINFYIPLTRRRTRGNIKVLLAVRNTKGTFCPVLKHVRKLDVFLTVHHVLTIY